MHALGLSAALHYGCIFTNHVGIPMFMAGGKTMLRFVVALAATLYVAASGFAGGGFDAEAAAERWYAAHMACRLAETPDGEILSTEQADEWCGLRGRLTTTLQDAGYCYDPSERIWQRCD
jgi:hypothetical protein